MRFTALPHPFAPYTVSSALTRDALLPVPFTPQASFDPPGITVSVKKDRAMGQLLVVGGKFALSMVAEGRDRPVMKRLTKPFSPGEDRLAGEEGGGWEAGGVVMECRVGRDGEREPRMWQDE